MESRKRKRCVDSEDEGKKLSREQKNLIADRMVMADEEDRKNFLKLLKKSRYAISDRSLRRWQQRYHEGRAAVLAHHVNPRSEVLTEEHKLLIAGYILRCLDVNEPKDNLEVCEWLKHNLDVKVSSQTVRLVTRSMGFSSQAVRTKRSGYKLTRTASAELYAKYLNEIARPTLRSNPSELVCSIDFTYTSHFTDAQRKLNIVNSYVRVSAICLCSMLSPFFCLKYAKSDLKQPFRFSNQGCS